jgi:hypothetical protein
VTRVAVLIDWQNVYKAARRAFDLEALPNERGNFSPLRLSRLLTERNARGTAGIVVRVEIHRGLPSASRDPVGYSANRRQAAAWIAEDRKVVIPRLRPLRYSRDPREPPIEKGIDVQLAISAVELVLLGRCDVVVLFSHDTDLLPAIEAVARLASPKSIETASWRSSSFSSRLRARGVRDIYHHDLPARDFAAVETPVNYAYRG